MLAKFISGTTKQQCDRDLNTMGNVQSSSSHCIGCGDPLTKANKSDAHIIPNALGGRLAPDDLICQVCNGVLDRAVDNALVKAFGGVQTLIDLPRVQTHS